MLRVINGIRVDVEADRQRASQSEMCGEIVNCDNKKWGGGGQSYCKIQVAPPGFEVGGHGPPGPPCADALGHNPRL